MYLSRIEQVCARTDRNAIPHHRPKVKWEAKMCDAVWDQDSGVAAPVYAAGRYKIVRTEERESKVRHTCSRTLPPASHRPRCARQTAGQRVLGLLGRLQHHSLSRSSCHAGGSCHRGAPYFSRLNCFPYCRFRLNEGMKDEEQQGFRERTVPDARGRPTRAASSLAPLEGVRQIQITDENKVYTRLTARLGRRCSGMRLWADAPLPRYRGKTWRRYEWDIHGGWVTEPVLASVGFKQGETETEKADPVDSDPLIGARAGVEPKSGSCNASPPSQLWTTWRVKINLMWNLMWILDRMACGIATVRLIALLFHTTFTVQSSAHNTIFFSYFSRSQTEQSIITANYGAALSADAHAIRVDAVAESYLNVGGICCFVL
jgi:hypothetical protein